MTIDRRWLRVLFVAALIGVVPTLSRAGGVGFGEDDANNSDDGPSYFGFVREVDGPGVADAKVTAATSCLSVKGFARNANCWPSAGRCFWKASSA